MKKKLSILLVAVMMTMFTACGGGSVDTGVGNGNQSNDTYVDNSDMNGDDLEQNSEQTPSQENSTTTKPSHSMEGTYWLCEKDGSVYGR